MNLVDSHTHLYFSEQFPNPSEAVERAVDAGVSMMILPGVNSSTIEPVKKLHSLFPLNTAMAIGLHPSDVRKETMRHELDVITEEANNNRDCYVGIGEIGIDLHWDATTLDFQQQAFKEQLEMAMKLGKPAILHSRDAFDQTHEVLNEGFSQLPMVFHSYSGDIKETERILSLYPDAYFGINGIVTFKNARIKEVLDVIPHDRLLIETDAPYLAPVPHRGKTNESAFLVDTARFISEYMNLSLEELATITTRNAERLFNIKVA